MDLDFDDQQEALRALAREVCDDYATIEVVRAMEDDPHGVPEALWKQLGETGLVGIRIAEEHGGMVQVDNPSAGGAKLTVRLPANPQSELSQLDQAAQG